MTEQEFLRCFPAETLHACRESIQGGFEDYPRNYAHVADLHDSRTVANLIHCHIVGRAKDHACTEEFVFLHAGQRNLFILLDRVIVVFKKLDEKLRSQNYPTSAAQKFNAQEEIIGIPASLPRVELGYVTDVAGASLNGIYAVQRIGSVVDWSIDLFDADEPRQRDIKFA